MPFWDRRSPYIKPRSWTDWKEKYRYYIRKHKAIAIFFLILAIIIIFVLVGVIGFAIYLRTRH